MFRMSAMGLGCLLSLFFGYQYVFAETVTGGGYTIEQTIAPIQGVLTGNGYIVGQSSQAHGDTQVGGGYIVNGVFGTSLVASSSSGGGGNNGGGGSGGGGYYVFPPYATTTASTSTPKGGDSPVPIGSGSTCSSRITFSAPIDIGSPTNRKDDVKKLEFFLNTYENEKLPINGIYEVKDISAVKRWQSKYRSFILDPMRLKYPTGTIYTLSQRQIERQTTKVCGEKIIVTACPFFREYVSYGDRGESVKKIQQFLNIVRGEKLIISGVYGPLTKLATKRFQQAYKKDIFSILKWSFISGNWNEATRVKANQAIGCDVVK